MNLVTSAVFLEPQHFSVPAPWAGHIPFASWLISAQRPETLVELGTYSGISYLAFCQAIKEQGLTTRAFAVDTWEGDVHAGAYDESIYQSIKEAHDPHYSSFSNLLRMTFDDALTQFQDGSVDLLHIDGLHTYEAVKHDFDTWLPKLSSRGIVLFHDTNVYRDDFGVHRLWADLSPNYPSLHFSHSNGLGVLLVGLNQPADLLSLCDVVSADFQNHARTLFATLGARLERKAEVLTLEHQLHDAKVRENHLQEAGEKRHKWIEHLDQQVLELQRKLAQATQFDALHKIPNKSAELAPLEPENIEVAIAGRDEVVNFHREEGARLSNEILKIYASKSWRITRPLRFAAGIARGEFSHALGSINSRLGNDALRMGVERVSKGLKLLFKGEIRELSRRISMIRRKNRVDQWRGSSAEASKIYWGILTPPHTRFIAQLIAHQLQRHGWNFEILTTPPRSFNHDLYFVLCPQIFDRLPPGEKRIAYQLEQSVSSRWFSIKYFKILEESLAVLEYSLVNIEFLSDKNIAYPQVTYLPIGYLQEYGRHVPPQEKLVDVLFYGDSLSSPRRAAMLKALSKKFSIKIVNDTFGDEMLKIIKSARLVVNIHYYENALLETPRILECLSLGVPVVSEGTRDQDEYPELLQQVMFFREGDIEDMVATVASALKGEEIVRTNRLSASPHRFSFFFDRFLIGLGLLPVSIARQMELPVPQQADTFGLSLPETIERRRIFEASRPHDCVVFDGIRRSPGWVGCGLSYSALAEHALRNGMHTMTVMEDDVILPVDYLESLPIIRSHLASLGDEWDVFAGVIASLHPDTKILSVTESNGRMFVTIDKMTSMVFNIYSERAMRIFQEWDPNLLDAQSNTIDRFLESRTNVRVVTTYPYFVGHREEVSSTLWGFRNSVYLQMIRDSEATLKLKIDRFLLDRERQTSESFAG